MTFRQIQGNAGLCGTLAGMVDSGRVPHAILFHEDDGGGAFPLCVAFLQYLYCHSRSGGDSCGTCPSCNKIGKLIHPDVHIVFPVNAARLSVSYMPEFRSLFESRPDFRESELSAALKIEGKNSIIAVAESKRLLDILSLSALEGGYRSVIIYLPEKMNAEASNKLLKMIEEPPQLTQFLLITHRPENILPTISSRCQRIRVAPGGGAGVALADFDRPELFSGLMESLLSKNLLSCIEAGENITALPSRESAKAFCRYAAENLRHIFLCRQGLADLGTASPDASRWAAAFPEQFPRKALSVLDRSMTLIDRNVNMKILFTDMVDRLYLLI